MAHGPKKIDAARFRCEGRFEREARARGYALVAGTDEVGRGALFGPVYAAAVILSPERPIRGLDDSKQIDPDRREVLAARIQERAVAWAVGACDAYEIDRINILEASRLAMRRAISQLAPQPDFLLTDAVEVELDIPQLNLIKGDARSRSIAAASIVAKVHRDACMRRWHEVFPHFGLDSNKGYSTGDHLRALRLHGPTSLHRFSFSPVREASRVELWRGYESTAAQGDLFDQDAPELAWPEGIAMKAGAAR